MLMIIPRHDFSSDFGYHAIAMTRLPSHSTEVCIGCKEEKSIPSNELTAWRTWFALPEFTHRTLRNGSAKQQKESDNQQVDFCCVAARRASRVASEHGSVSPHFNIGSSLIMWVQHVLIVGIR